MKNKKKEAQKTNPKSSQQYLPIQEIREDMVVLKDGTVRGVFIVSSINFALKSEDEQNAVIGSYVGFLNSIDHALQIVVQSRRLQIKPYLEQLQKIERTQENELLRVQIANYRAFITELVELGEIMTKRFFVVVPFDPISNKKRGFFSRLSEVFRPLSNIKLKEKTFQQRRADLEDRMRQVQSGLESMGLSVARLNTQALIELYYASYNPDISFAEELAPIEELQIEE